MNALRLCTIMAVICSGLGFTLSAEAQVHRNRALEAIGQDFRRGQIDLDRKVLYQLQASVGSPDLPGTYASADPQPVRCGTPFIIEYVQRRAELSASTLREAERLTAPAAGSAAETWPSPSGRFRLNYEISGEHAVPPADVNSNGVPDFVERTAQAADSSWNHLVGRLGFTDPITDEGPYEIYFRNFNLYGRTVQDGNTTWIEVHSTFENFPPNSDPEGDAPGAMKVTIAHELKHAIQYANSRWYSTSDGNGPHALTWSEMDATHMEEVVYDNVNDYYHYISSSDAIFIASSHRMPVAYSGVSWNIFVEEQYDIGLWVEVWRRIRLRFEEENGILMPDYYRMPDVLDEVLQEQYGETFAGAVVRSHLWHYASGSLKSAVGFGFEERLFYPDATVNERQTGLRETMTPLATLAGRSAIYVEIIPADVQVGRVAVDVAHSNPQVQVGLIGYFSDGTADVVMRPGSAAGITTLTVSWNWSEVTEVGMILSNSSGTGSDIQYRIYSAAPSVLELSPGYPNPFRDRTTIRYAVPERSEVQLRVYDINARLVRTLEDAVLDPGQYESVFDGSGLASGVYLIRLTGAGETLLEKVTHIR